MRLPLAIGAVVLGYVYGEKTMPSVHATGVEAYLDSPEFEAALADDDGLAAKEHLAAGRAIYYGDERYPDGLVKEYPNGRKRLVAVTPDGEVLVIRDL